IENMDIFAPLFCVFLLFDIIKGMAPEYRVNIFLSDMDIAVPHDAGRYGIILFRNEPGLHSFRFDYVYYTFVLDIIDFQNLPQLRRHRHNSALRIVVQKGTPCLCHGNSSWTPMLAASDRDGK